MAKIFKLSGYFVDVNGEFNNSELEAVLADSCDIIAHHIKVEEQDIGEWEDDNPLNCCDCSEKECEKYFLKKTPCFSKEMRLIDAEKLTEKINMCRKEYNGFNNIDGVRAIDIAQSLIYQAPTIEAEPVRHGKWIKDESEFSIKLHCSVCGEDAVCSRNAWGDPEEYFRTDFCPNCGARMAMKPLGE